MENKITAKGNANETVVDESHQLYAEEKSSVFYNLFMYSCEILLILY